MGGEDERLAFSTMWWPEAASVPAAGKTAVARTVAGLAGQELVEVALSGGTDTSDLLGGFEQLEPSRRLQVVLMSGLASQAAHAVSSEKGCCVLNQSSLYFPLGLHIPYILPRRGCCPIAICYSAGSQLEHDLVPFGQIRLSPGCCMSGFRRLQGAPSGAVLGRRHMSRHHTSGLITGGTLHLH